MTGSHKNCHHNPASPFRQAPAITDDGESRLVPAPNANSIVVKNLDRRPPVKYSSGERVRINATKVRATIATEKPMNINQSVLVIFRGKAALNVVQS